jgi:lipopolysaccharide export system permease protein
MKKLIFVNFNIDVLKFFITSMLVMGIIVWTIQAVNFFDFVTNDGHGLRVYFLFSILNFPKILDRILPFIFFISIFYTIIKYEQTNELNIFWLNGITKINFINKIIFISILLMIAQILIANYVSPPSQLKARYILKNSNMDFFGTLIKEKKFINKTKGLTIFINEKDDNGLFKKVFLEEIRDNNSKIIIAEDGLLIFNNEQKIFKLKNGQVINNSNNKVNIFNFDVINFDLSKIITNTITVPKIQEIYTNVLLSCIFDLTIKNKYNFECKNEINDEIKQELLKRIYKPLYIPVIALISCCLILYSKNHYNYLIVRNSAFLFNFFIILISEASLKYSSESIYTLIAFITLPIVIFLITYLFICRIFKNA